MQKPTETQRPVDHVRPLPPAVIGRGKDEMTDAEIAALYPVDPFDELERQYGGAR